MLGLTGLVYGISRGGLSGWSDPLVVGPLVAAAILLPLFVADRAPPALRRCSTSSIFENRLFSASAAAAFINGLSRFALLFIFVFYFQGAQGDDPITAGVKLAPMALGMLVASPLAGMVRRPPRLAHARRRRHGRDGRRARRDDHARGRTPRTGRRALWLALVGIGSGMFNSPNTAAMMGVVPLHRRGIAAGARVMLQNTGAVISIAFVMAIVTSAVPKPVLFKIFSGITSGLSSAQARPVHREHAPRAVGARRRVADRRVRRAHAAVAPARARPGARHGMSAVAAAPVERPLRIGELAELTGTTPRTIRYYEEIGLLPRRRTAPRASAAIHRATTSSGCRR